MQNEYVFERFRLQLCSYEPVWGEIGLCTSCLVFRQGGGDDCTVHSAQCALRNLTTTTSFKRFHQGEAVAGVEPNFVPGHD